jgi:hypothetical protein
MGPCSGDMVAERLTRHRGHRGAVTDLPTPPVSAPPLRWRTYCYPEIPPPSKNIWQNVNQRTRYHPSNPVGFCQKYTPLFVAGSFCYPVGSGVYPPSSFLPLTPYPLFKGCYPVLNIFCSLCFGLGGGVIAPQSRL